MPILNVHVHGEAVESRVKHFPAPHPFTCLTLLLPGVQVDVMIQPAGLTSVVTALEDALRDLKSA